MFLSVLKMLGFDVRAKVEQARAEFEQRVDLAKARIRHAATTASVLAIIFVMAGLAGLTAIGVGLSALFTWVSIHYGQFYGYAAVGVLLVVISTILFIVGMVEAKSWPTESGPSHVGEKITLPANDAENERSVGAVSAANRGANEQMVAAPTQSEGALFSFNDADSGLAETLRLVLSHFIRLPVTGNPVVDDVIASLREPAHRMAEDAINSTAEVIRHGERQKLIAVLSAAMLAGFLLERLRSR
jgi:Putative Actinobacterial Holin-X, holin superfamily III